MPNFKEAETELLVEEVIKWAHVIENKTSDSDTWKKKDAAWKAVTDGFNATKREYV